MVRPGRRRGKIARLGRSGEGRLRPADQNVHRLFGLRRLASGRQQGQDFPAPAQHRLFEPGAEKAHFDQHRLVEKIKRQKRRTEAVEPGDWGEEDRQLGRLFRRRRHGRGGGREELEGSDEFEAVVSRQHHAAHHRPAVRSRLEQEQTGGQARRNPGRPGGSFFDDRFHEQRQCGQ